MDTEERCMGCMKPKGTQWVCPHCGYRNKPRNPIVLPYQAVLNNKFLVGRILGKPGGFGVTYLAWDLVLHTTVAVKEYFPGKLAMRSPDHSTVVFNGDKDKEEFDYGLEQFLLEARTLAQFSHPNIVRVREFFQQNNTAYLVMDYYEGISLEDFVQRKGGKIAENLAVSLLLPILEGLQQVHQKKILHRDIKPANIYLTHAGMAILLDFGAARFAMGKNSETLSVILTEGFAPFEQYLDKAGELLGPWTDIYGYGATLYAITTGTTPDNAINRHQRDKLLAPIQIVPTLSPRFSDALMAALALDTQKRPRSAQAFRNLLCNGNPQWSAAAPNLLVVAGENIAAIAKSSHTTQDETAAENPTTANFSGVKQNRFVRCPHCKTLNNIATGMSFEQLHCRRCGKKMAETDSSLFGGKWLAFVTIVLVIAGMLMKGGEKSATKPTIAARLQQLKNVKANPSQAAQTQTEIKTEAAPKAVIETSDISLSASQTPSQEQPAIVTDQEPAPANPIEQARPPLPHPPRFLPHDGPPESAFEACRGKRPGDSCQDPKRPGDPYGICDAPTAYHDLACRPLRPLR